MLHVKQKQQGLIAILTALVALVLVIMATLATAYVVVTEQREYKNTRDYYQAENAARAGFDYAFAYLAQKLYINVNNGTAWNMTFPDGSNYTVTYQFIGGVNTLIQITSVGISADGTGQRTVSGLIKGYPLSSSTDIPAVTIPITTRWNVRFYNDAYAQNTSGSTLTMQMGGAVTLATSQNATYLGAMPAGISSWGILNDGIPSGGGFMGPDIQQNLSAQSSMTNIQRQTTYIGMPITSLLPFADFSVNASSYTISGVWPLTRRLSYIDVRGFTLTIASGATIGQPDQPVTLVVNGRCYINNNVTIYGNIYANNQVQIGWGTQIYGMIFSSDNHVYINETASAPATTINGGIVGGGNVHARRSVVIIYDAALLTDYSLRYYGIVPGSWKEY